MFIDIAYGFLYYLLYFDLSIQYLNGRVIFILRLNYARFVKNIDSYFNYK